MSVMFMQRQSNENPENLEIEAGKFILVDPK